MKKSSKPTPMSCTINVPLSYCKSLICARLSFPRLLQHRISPLRPPPAPCQPDHTLLESILSSAHSSCVSLWHQGYNRFLHIAIGFFHYFFGSLKSIFPPSTPAPIPTISTSEALIVLISFQLKFLFSESFIPTLSSIDFSRLRISVSFESATFMSSDS